MSVIALCTYIIADYHQVHIRLKGTSSVAVVLRLTWESRKLVAVRVAVVVTAHYRFERVLEKDMTGLVAVCLDEAAGRSERRRRPH
jgi:hypothetical protein